MMAVAVHGRHFRCWWWGGCGCGCGGYHCHCCHGIVCQCNDGGGFGGHVALQVNGMQLAEESQCVRQDQQLQHGDILVSPQPSFNLQGVLGRSLGILDDTDDSNPNLQILHSWMWEGKMTYQGHMQELRSHLDLLQSMCVVVRPRCQVLENKVFASNSPLCSTRHWHILMRIERWDEPSQCQGISHLAWPLIRCVLHLVMQAVRPRWCDWIWWYPHIRIWTTLLGHFKLTTNYRMHGVTTSEVASLKCSHTRIFSSWNNHLTEGNWYSGKD